MQSVEEIITNRINHFLMKIAAEWCVDGEEAGARPPIDHLLKKLDGTKLSRIFDQILLDSEEASTMPRPEFRKLFYDILRKRMSVGPGDHHLQSAIRRERRRRKIFDRPKPALSCPICLGLPHLVSDPFTEFHRCGPDCTGQHYIYSVSQCHPHTGMMSEYCEQHSILTLMCNRCEKPIMAFQLTTPAAGRITAVQ